MQARIKNPALVIPGALEALEQLGNASAASGIPETTLYLVHLRASQINGCSVCVDIHSREMEFAGEPRERVNMVAAWREAPYFTDAERAALALTEAMTRLADREDPVPDAVWSAAAVRFDDKQLAGLVLHIANINVWNRLNVATRQVAGAWTP
jgi:AhpD family alkylhydroperoxidase